MNKSTVFSAALFLLITFLSVQTSRSQTIELVAGNTLNGAMNGVILGGATMALQNSSDFDPVRVGLGAGTLYGISVGIYDISSVEAGQQFYISGAFNDGTNTTILVLLDTFYGATAGAVIASSVSLINQQPVVDALRYGSGIGAWTGFGFGLIDAFVRARRPGDLQQAAFMHRRNRRHTGGLLTYANADGNFELGLISPSLTRTKTVTADYAGSRVTPSLDILQFNIRL